VTETAWLNGRSRITSRWCLPRRGRVVMHANMTCESISTKQHTTQLSSLNMTYCGWRHNSRSTHNSSGLRAQAAG